MTELERLRAMRDALEQMVERLGRKEVHATRDQVREHLSAILLKGEDE